MALKRGAPLLLDNSIEVEDDGNIETQQQPSVVDDIQPLRDLAKNFDLDITEYLNEYLELTSHQSLSEDGEGGDEDGDNGETTAQNFATAALKIQNSVGVYVHIILFLDCCLIYFITKYSPSLSLSNLITFPHTHTIQHTDITAR